MDIGADGLKTGYLEESGYGLSASAVQNGPAAGPRGRRPEDGHASGQMKPASSSIGASAPSRRGSSSRPATPSARRRYSAATAARFRSSRRSRCGSSCRAARRPDRGANRLSGTRCRPPWNKAPHWPSASHARRRAGARPAALRGRGRGGRIVCRDAPWTAFSSFGTGLVRRASASLKRG